MPLRKSCQMSNLLPDDEFTFGIVEVVNGDFKVQLEQKLSVNSVTKVDIESLTGAGPLRARPEIS